MLKSIIPQQKPVKGVYPNSQLLSCFWPFHCQYADQIHNKTKDGYSHTFYMGGHSATLF